MNIFTYIRICILTYLCVSVYYEYILCRRLRIKQGQSLYI